MIFAYFTAANDRESRADYRDTVVHQRVGIHDGHELMEQVWLRLKQLRSQFLHDRLKVLCSVTRSSIPGLWLAPAQKANSY